MLMLSIGELVEIRMHDPVVRPTVRMSRKRDIFKPVPGEGLPNLIGGSDNAGTLSRLEHGLVMPMLQNTFVHLPGVGPRRERAL
jgi:hypothetical protein